MPKFNLISRSTHVQEFNPLPLQEVNIYEPVNINSTNHDKFPYDEPITKNIDLPIALRKGTRVVSKHAYPLANYLSFNKFSPLRKIFLISLNTTIYILLYLRH